MPVGRTRLIVVAAVAGFALIGWSNAHHWDEYFYLYSSFIHSPSELLHYELSSAIFPPGYFTEKIGHVVLLRVLTRLLGPGDLSLYAIQAVFTALLLGYVWASYRLLRDLFGPGEARDSTLVLLFSPLTLYLAYKLLSEVPSLLFVTLGTWSFVRSYLAAAPRARGIAMAGAVPLLAVGALCRITGIVAFPGLVLGLLVVGDPRFGRGRLLIRAVLTGVAAALLYTGVLAWYGGNVFRVLGDIHQVVSLHPPLERAFALGSFVQTFAIALPFAWLERSRPLVRISAVWLVLTTVPFLAGHEPRYYAPAMTPLAILTAVGLRSLARRLAGARSQYAGAGLFAVLVLINRLFLIPLMPYEVEQGRLLGLFHQLQKQAPGATYLVPWISDYSLLRFSSPGSRVELCLSELPGSRVSEPGHAGQLDASDRWWAGASHYIGSEKTLAKEPRPWEYLGWTYNPADMRLIHLLRDFGVPAPTGVHLHNHLAGSWIWTDPLLRRTLTEQSGPYFVYQLQRRSGQL
ncbi:MAG TPA: glycosyltransferase family 39 protein [Gemmatimonadales bacterium]